MALASAGTVKTNYGYDPYGASNATGTASTNTFQFTGRENDGTGLLNYRNRYYSSAWGRFVSEDPIGLQGGVNVYAYANADPTDLRDPSGLLPIDPGVGLPSPGTGPSGGLSAPDGTSVDPANWMTRCMAVVRLCNLLLNPLPVEPQSLRNLLIYWPLVLRERLRV